MTAPAPVPFGTTTANDDAPMNNFGGTADNGAAVTDSSADVNVAGANDVAANARAEAQEIAAVPDPQSPAGQAAILAIIEKYHGKSSGTVEGSAATEQANGSQAADDHDSDDDDDHDSGTGSSGTSLMDILGQLLGAGGSSMQGMNPMGQQGMSPFGQQGASPFGDPYGQQGASTQAADPFADPFASSSPGGAPATTASYNAAADPFATSPSPGTGTITAASADPSAAADPFSTADNSSRADGNNDSHNGDDATNGDAQGAGTDPAGASESSTSGVDAGAFGGADGSAVPADPASASSGATTQ